MKIAFDNQIFNQQQYGGISRYIAHLAEEFYQLHHEVKVFAGLNNNYYLQNLPLEIVKGRHIRFPAKTRRVGNIFNQIVMPKALERWQPQIIHKTYYNDKKFKYPTVVTVHDMIHELFADNFSPKDRTSELKKITVNNADHIIAISNSTKNDLINFFNIPDNRISVIYHGFDKFESDKSTNKLLANDKPFILYVGQRQGYKNFQNLLTAYSNSSLQKEFNLVAFGGGKFTVEEQNRIKQLNLELKVQQIGGNDNVLGSLYENALAFIYPSLYEGFGMPPLEAMAHNCPVVSSNTSSMPEVIGEAALFFNPSDVQDIQSKIEQIVNDIDLQVALKLKGKQRVQQFSWQKCAEQTLDVYKMLVK